MPTKRILTALVLIIIVTNSVLFLPTPWVAMLLEIPMLFGIMEWSLLSGLNQIISKIIVTVICFISTLIWYWILNDNYEYMLIILIITNLWWLIISVYLLQIQHIVIRNNATPSLAIIGIFILLTTWGSLVWLHSQTKGSWLLLYFLILIWIADSCAYFVGHHWGKIKLAPLLSPSKTLEGAYGGLAGAVIWGVLLAIFFGNGLWNRIELLLLCLLTVIASIIGDLYESLLKRERNLKDSGDLLPGHGGVLDRIDSLTAAAPIFVLGLVLLGVI